ncbi:hypothetical protein PO909_007375 [Leuciscus waleckii]
MQLCPKTASTWRDAPPQPSHASRFSSGLTRDACKACGDAASALHAMALLQVHQAKALHDMQGGGLDPGLLQELRAKVTAHSLRRAMSTLVVQKRHLWLTLADMREAEKNKLLNFPISQGGLFGDAVESFAQEFSTAQKQSEAIRHVLHRRRTAAGPFSVAVEPPAARRRGRPPAAAPPSGQQSNPGGRRSGRKRAAQPAQVPPAPSHKKNAIDLKDVYFHVSILPRHRPFLRFAFEGRAYQYKVLPFGLALSPRVFTKVAEVAIVPMREQGVRILNYLDDWLILAHFRDVLCDHRDMVLRHLSRLGLQVNWDKSKLCPMQRISYLVWNWTRSPRLCASRRNVSSQCSPASGPFEARQRFH